MCNYAIVSCVTYLILISLYTFGVEMILFVVVVVRNMNCMRDFDAKMH